MSHQEIVDIVKDRGYSYFPEALELASGKLSHHFVDGKRALSHTTNLYSAALAVLEVTDALGSSSTPLAV